MRNDQTVHINIILLSNLATLHVVVALSIVELRPGVPVQKTLGSDLDGVRLPHYYVFNVSDTSEVSKLSVQLKQFGNPDADLMLSVCPGMLPCGDLGCACPSEYVDVIGNSDSAPKVEETERRVNISPCELEQGLWYISVELNPQSAFRDNGRAVRYSISAILQDASLAFGKTKSGDICCGQKDYFVVDIERLQKNHELRIRLESDDRRISPHPLGLSASNYGCIHDEESELAGPSMSPALVVDPVKVKAGRLYIAVHGIGRAETQFLLTATYRPELKWVVFLVLLSMVLIVVATCFVVCTVRLRKRLHKQKEFTDEVSLRRLKIKQGASGSERAQFLIEESDESEDDR